MSKKCCCSTILKIYQNRKRIKDTDNRQYDNGCIIIHVLFIMYHAIRLRFMFLCVYIGIKINFI